MALKEYMDGGTRTVRLLIGTTETEAWWREAAKRRVAVKCVVTNAAYPGADGDIQVEPLNDNDVVFAGVIVDTSGTGSNFRGTLLYRTAGIRASDIGSATTVTLNGTHLGDGLRGAADGHLKIHATTIPKNQGGPAIVGGDTSKNMLISFNCVSPITA